MELRVVLAGMEAAHWLTLVLAAELWLDLLAVSTCLQAGVATLLAVPSLQVTP
jgi:hypothetical protein